MQSMRSDVSFFCRPESRTLRHRHCLQELLGVQSMRSDVSFFCRSDTRALRRRHSSSCWDGHALTH